MPGSKETIALVALGTNLPYRGLAGARLLAAAIEAIAAPDLAFRAASSAWESPAWPPSDQPPFVNAAAAFAARGWTAEALLERLLRVEASFGRERRERWAARTLDLDLIDFGGARLDVPGLTLPHPRLQDRAFVLGPLAELAPDWRHPLSGEGAAALLAKTDRTGLARAGGLPVANGAIAESRLND